MVPAKPIIDAYMAGVLDGSIPAGTYVRKAVERHVRDLETGEARGLYFDEEAGQRVIDFFAFLKHSKGEWAGQTFELSPWQQFLLWVLFGWKRADGTRRFRAALAAIARKNGKSTLAAGIGLYLFAADGEPGAEVYTAATKRDQAKIVFAEAKRMVERSPSLRRKIGTYVANLNIPGTASKFEPLGADEDTMDGLNVHAAIIDELHAHKGRGVWDVLETATGARRQPMQFAITTAGFDRQSICWELWEYSIKILDGVIEDDSFFAFIAAADKDDEWTDPVTWAKANPNLGVSVKMDDLQRKCEKAKNIPAAQNSFKRLHLNLWTQQSVRWLDIAAWDACGAPVNPSEFSGWDCYAGLDLASTTDIAALALVFPDDEDYADEYSVLPFFWIPADNILERVKKDRVPYDVWVQQGYITATPGNVIDYKAITAKLDELAQIYDIKELGFDRWGATQLVQELQDKGLNVIPIGQGFAGMTAATKELQKLVLSKKIRHGGNPVLRWMADNMVVKQDPAGNLKPDKEKSTEKIDGMVATIMGLDRATRRSVATSVYDERGILVLGDDDEEL